MRAQPAPFLLLKLRSCDDLEDLKVFGEKTPVRLDLRLAYSDELAALPALHRMALDLFGFSRTFLVLAVEPVQDGTHVFTFYPTPGQPVVKPTVHSIAAAWAGHVANRPSLATTKQQMQQASDLIADYFSRQGAGRMVSSN
jgi:hypothetical protein